MNLFDFVPEPLLLLVIGVTSLLFGLVLRATRDDDAAADAEKAAEPPVEVSHSVAAGARAD